MRSPLRQLVLLVLCSGAALAEGQSYMSLVGELLGAVETPRMFRDGCAMRVPATAAERAQLYDEWRVRHKALLDAADEQVARANERLKKQAAPETVDPVSKMKEAASRMFDEHLDKMTSQDLKEYCGSYAAYLKYKDDEFKNSVPQLLKVVTEADRALTEREKT
jgi:hypothetical protein